MKCDKLVSLLLGADRSWEFDVYFLFNFDRQNVLPRVSHRCPT